MSYEIFYGKQFVRLNQTGEIIPMVLTGSNNTYEIRPDGKDGRRSRDWVDLTYYAKGNLSINPSDLLNAIDQELIDKIERNKTSEYRQADDTPESIRKRYGYYTSIAINGSTVGTSFDKWRNFFATGIKKAKTIEELHTLGIHLYFHTYPPSVSTPAETTITTEDEYFATLNQWQQFKETGKSLYLGFLPLDTDTILSRLKAPRTTPKPKVPTTQDHYFVLTNGNTGLLRYTRRGYRYGWDESSGKKFRTEKEADKYRTQLITNKRYKADTWQVKRIDRPYSFLVTQK